MAPTFNPKSTTTWALTGFTPIAFNIACSFEAALVTPPNHTRLYGHYHNTSKTSMIQMIFSSAHRRMSHLPLPPHLWCIPQILGIGSLAPSIRSLNTSRPSTVKQDPWSNRPTSPDGKGFPPNTFRPYPLKNEPGNGPTHPQALAGGTLRNLSFTAMTSPLPFLAMNFPMEINASSSGASKPRVLATFDRHQSSPGRLSFHQRITWQGGRGQFQPS